MNKGTKKQRFISIMCIVLIVAMLLGTFIGALL